MWLQAPPEAHHAMQGYAGSVAFSGDGRSVAITSPRGGLVQVFDAGSGAWRRSLALPDVCGLAPAQKGFVASTGAGAFYHVEGDAPAKRLRSHGLAWDNHIVPIPAPVPV